MTRYTVGRRRLSGWGEPTRGQVFFSELNEDLFADTAPSVPDFRRYHPAVFGWDGQNNPSVHVQRMKKDGRKRSNVL